MSFWAVALTALAVSADAFVVALGRGTSMRGLDVRAGLVLAGVFGSCQAVMPAAGWCFGAVLQERVHALDHWCAFALLCVVGGKMLLDALGSPAVAVQQSWRFGVVLALGVATSVDALAVGVGFAVVDVDIVLAVLVIGVTAFALSCAGVVIGHRAGVRHRRAAGALGGLVLIALGVRILLGGLAG